MALWNQINALISTLSTISRSALAVGVSAAVSQRQWIRLNRGVHPLADLEMHDSASQGPWGSMSLLISLGWSDIVSLGAMVTILSLAMDPFVQQIATFESAPAPFGNSSIVSRVIFEAGMNSTDNSVFYQGFVQAPQSFSPHIYQGLYFDGDLNDNFLRNSLQLHPRSSGGNVSYGVSESLAVCSACANLTDKLRAPERSAKDPDQCSTDEGCCKWDLPNGASSGWTRFGDRSTNVMGLNATTNPVVLNTTGQLRILYVNAILPGWEITSRDDDDQPIDGVGVEGLAQECALYWCVNKYESSLSAGIFNETIIFSFSAGDFEPEPFHRVFAIRPPGSNSSFHRGNSHDYGNYSTGWINGTFLVNVDASGLIRRPLEELFSGYATTLNSYQEWAPISSNPTVLRLYMTARKHDPSQVPRFDMSNIMEAVALGMSTVLRTTDPTHEGNDALKSVVGTETAMQIIVRVRWAWIVLPVILQLAAHLFFWQTMITSRSRRLHSWKSSALAVFFFGARKEREVAHSEVERLIDMEAIAKETVIVVEGRKSKGI
ncbi:hypothetical protein BDP81DRAFT_355918 [Colletotrichum phormii]|uniref:Uncharacterized protein n=1 Tax=Colletotrichum phormii TaxID=359342 RepID=A0AAJ0EDB5_9PEZI|nr:uncharacterized protein BDP81DRAFT_355918 [Colletotrichum phormii]KAK1625427.1 hypothetical protein BDP81DRAFT_355918 [Colletotrichum phormii]